ncbi:unnamed protein product [Staurois parvus]|uniref:Uncharacterized protein n=1 Tax=Staurois parvus TaxID=386267 RepID=A0ABN9B0A6_9NEOB|nr:unnamed protein product [Staurois parvus]
MDSSHGNPPERCPRPLYSRDSTQEGHTIPHLHQSGILGDDNIDVNKKSIKRRMRSIWSDGGVFRRTKGYDGAT